MQGIFLYSIGVAFASGIILRSFFDIGYAEIGLMFLIGSASFIAWRLQKSVVGTPLFLVGIACFSLAFGVSRLEGAEKFVSGFTQYENTEMTFEGVVAREPETRENATHLYIKPLRNDRVYGERILVTLNSFAVLQQDISYGDRVQVSGVLTKPEAFETDNGRVFDYAGFLKARGVTYVVWQGDVQVQENEKKSLLGTLFRGKRAFMEAIENAVPEPYAGLGEGLLLGVKRALGKDLEDVFRETGIIHIVVLSGYNIMLVAEGIMIVLGYFFLPRMRMILGISAIVLFALLVGFSATVVRASIMAALLLIARGTGKSYAVLRALVLAGICMLLINPYLLVHDPGFQLSFLATLGLLLLAPYIASKMSSIPQLFGIQGFMAATLATQIFVLPFILYYMGTFSVVAALVNVLVLPMVPIAMFLTGITGFVGVFSSILGMGLGFITQYALAYIIVIPQFFAALPFASFEVPAFPFWIVTLAYVALIIFMMRVIRNTVPEEDPTKGWTIEEVDEKSLAPLRGASDEKKSFPFR